MKIGIFGGTFNPPHHGHLNLAIELKEKCSLDEVWFIPASISPFRLEEKILSPAIRFDLVNLLIQGMDGFKTVDIEIKREPPSFTVETVEHLKSQYPNDEFFLLLGEDVALSLTRWKEPLKLLKMAPPLIGTRTPLHFQKKMEDFPQELKEILEKGVVKTRLMDIEATSIRERLKKNLPCRHLLPSEVLDYIRKNEVYFS